MKRLMTTLATAIAFASMSLAAQAETVKTTTTKPVVTTQTTTTKTVVTHHKAVKGKKVHTAKKSHHKVAHKGKAVHHKKGGVAKSKEVNMDIPADIKINQSSSVTGTAAPVAPMVQPAPSTVVITPAPVVAPAVVTPAVVVR